MSLLTPSTLHPCNRSLGPRAVVTAVVNEVTKGLIQAWIERLQILIEVPLFIVAFLFFALFVGRGDQIASGRLEWTLDPTRVSWMFAVLLDSSASIPLGGDGGLLWLLSTSVAYLLAGITVFSVADALARRQGSVGRY